MKNLILKPLLWMVNWLLGYNPISINESLRYQLSLSVPMTEPILRIFKKVKEECIKIEPLGPSGQWKRRQVLKKIVNMGASERDAALAIELAIREIDPK
jgi:hypothetical protein